MELVTTNAFEMAAASLPGGESKPILKFQKGDWYLGQDSEDVALGTRLAANVLEAEWGWVRWRDGKPVERRMVRVATGQAPVSRDALGHNDKSIWETDKDGRPRDPWQFMIDIPAREVAGRKREVLLSGGSKGWDGCCKALFRAFGEGMRTHGDAVPVVELGGDKYEHKQYGITKVPTLTIAEWKSETELLAAPAKKTKF